MNASSDGSRNHPGSETTPLILFVQPTTEGLIMSNPEDTTPDIDQMVIKLDLKRVDPSNAGDDGSNALGDMISLEDLSQADKEKFSNAVLAIAEVFKMDPGMSQMSLERVVDVEGPSTGSLPLSALATILGQAGGTVPPSEPPAS